MAQLQWFTRSFLERIFEQKHPDDLKSILKKKCSFCGKKWVTNFYKAYSIDIFMCRSKGCRTLGVFQVVDSLPFMYKDRISIK